MKYLIMVYSNPSSREVWDGLPSDQRAQGVREHTLLSEDLAASGELIVAEALVDPSKAKRILVRDGQTVSADGPYPDAKEVLAGFYLLDCESEERAIEHASRIPESALGLVEVRAILDLGI